MELRAAEMEVPVMQDQGLEDSDDGLSGRVVGV